MDAIKHFNARFGQLKEDRQSHEGVWESIISHIAPDLKGYLNGANKDGTRKDDEIYDTAPVEYNRICAAGLFANITPPFRKWYQFDMIDRELSQLQVARMHLDEVSDLYNQIMNESNFYKKVFSCFYQLPPIGTAILYFEKDYEHVVHCRCLNVGEYWVGVNGKSQVDTLYREFKLRGMQLVELFGDGVPQEIRDEVKNDQNNEYTVVH